ncbi:MAG: hypothetical protein A2252_00240 [Elusimicrobia bacterium RIFOXYA2_FULL_39_19]|nr:MAG: hypothetical protein A2252_00240 [Elusimicrobia bacterium RIFOXYA2_FULL_39_19]
MINHNNIYKIIIFVYIFLLTGIKSYCAWETTTVDNSGNVGLYSGLAVDTSGYPHISYYAGSFAGEYSAVALDAGGYAHIAYYDWTNSCLKYAKYNGASWEVQVVDPVSGTGKHASIAVDGFGYPHISYFDNIYGDLRYAKWTGSSWNIQIVDGIDDAGEYTSIKIDKSSNPHIAYYDYSNGNLKYARWSGTSWSTQTIDSNGEVGRFCSLALDSSNNAHISYLDESSTSLKYAKYNGIAWSKETIDSAGTRGWFTSIALDSNNKPHISYQDWASGYLKYAYKTGASWVTAIVDNTAFVGEYTSIALDNLNYAYISYYDVSNGSLKFAKNTTGSWAKETVDTNETGRYTSIAVNPSNNNIHISYFDSKNFDLKYAKYNGSWNKTTIDGNPSDLKYAKKTNSFWSVQTIDSTDDKGEYTAIALGRDNSVHITYFDWTSNDLRYINWNQQSGWKTPAAVDSSGDIGQYSSVALDSNGYPHASYYDFANGDLKYAAYNGTVWAYETVYSTNDSGSYSSLALDENNYPHISFYDYTQGDLKYAYKNSTGWHYETVDSTGDTGIYASLELDAYNNPCISYYDWDNGDLRYAKKINGSWNLETVDSTGDTGWHTSLELDSTDRARIAYYDWTNGDLKYAFYNGSSWETQTVDNSGNTGEFCSLSLDRQNGAHISYIDLDNFNLKYAYLQGSTETYSIKGYVKNSSAEGIAGATITLSGYADDFCVTVSSGYYEFSGLITGSYYICASKTGYGFNPINYTYSPLNSNLTNQDFCAALISGNTYYISGYVQRASDSAGLAGTVVSLSGTNSGSYVSLTDGYYEFPNLSSGTYNVTPSKSGWVFTPGNKNFNPLNSNNTNQNFSAVVSTSSAVCSIKGYVKTVSGAGIDAATVVLSGNVSASYTTSSLGYYEFLNLSSGSYTVTPSKTGYLFTPLSYSYSNLNADITGQNFTGSSVTFYIKGYLKNAGLQGINGADVTLTHEGQSDVVSVTDSNGYYEFFNLECFGCYTVTPAKTGCAFNAINKIYSSLDGNKDNQDFTGTNSALLYKISGYIKNSAGSALPGVTVNVAGTAAGTLLTNVSGYYEIKNLLTGNYLLKPSKTGWNFNPEDLLVYTDTDKTGTDFTGLFGVINQSEEYCRPVNNLFNPHNGETTTIWYNILTRGAVKLKLYTLDGRLVKSFVDETKDLGTYTEIWNGKNTGGEIAGRGVYILYFQAPGIKEKKKIIIKQ